MIYQTDWTDAHTRLLQTVASLENELKTIGKKPAGLHDHRTLGAMRDSLLDPDVFALPHPDDLRYLETLGGVARAALAVRFETAATLKEAHSLFPSWWQKLKIWWSQKENEPPQSDAITAYLDFERDRFLILQNTLTKVENVAVAFDAANGLRQNLSPFETKRKEIRCLLPSPAQFLS